MKTVIISGASAAMSGWFNSSLLNIAKHADPEALVLNENTCVEFAQAALRGADRVVIISPVYWSRLPGKLEAWLDEVLAPRKVYSFVDIPLLTKYFGYKRAVSHCNIKEFVCVLSYGAPIGGTFGIPFARLGWMIGKLVLNAKKIKHIPTYLCEGPQGDKRRFKTQLKVSKLFD